MSAGATSCDVLLNEILEEQARRSPENVALEFHSDVSMTYHELNSQANRLARYLEKYKLQNGEVVAVCLEKSPNLVVAVLAILKAGLVWVPLPMDCPPARISSILSACDAKVALCSRSARSIAGDLAASIVLDDVLQESNFLALSNANLACIREPSDLCHILFTSGSTGVPKGVALEHLAVVHCVWAMVKEFGLTDKTRTLQFSAATFDAFSLDVFMSIACGGCLVMAPTSTMVADMTTFVRDAGITYAHLTPTVLDMIDPLGVPEFQTVSSTGEALSEKLASKWRGNVRLFNSYGPTETIVCTIQYLGDNQIDAACIGEAVPGLEVCLLVPGELDEVAQGEVGEICVAGPHLFRSYVSTEKVSSTASKKSECFRNGVRYYRTGDMGKKEACPGGGYTLRYLGRRDGQVKVHGVRTDLTDVEQSVLASDAVKNCIVVLPRAGPSEGRLCCIVTLRPFPTSEQKSEPRKAQFMGDSVELLNACDNVISALMSGREVAAGRLPVQALPTSWWAVKAFPLTSSGKIDRVKLRSLLEKMDNEFYVRHLNDFACKTQTQSSPPDTIEEQLQSIWADVLNRPISTINTTSSFIELGADSLDVIRLISKARKKGIELDIPQVYTAKTIRQLARVTQPLLDHQATVEKQVYRPFSGIPMDRPLGPLIKHATTVCQVGVEEIEDIFGTTPYQAGLMTSDLRSPGTYICAFSWTLHKSIDIEQFRSSWESLLANEPVLRSRLIWDATHDDLWQVVVRHREIDWSRECFQASMSVGTDLCRGFIKRHENLQGWKFFLKIHHSINDGWSLRLMLNRLRSIYFEQDLQSSPRLSFAEFMYHRIDEQNRKERDSSAFWGNYLEGSTPINFPPSPSESNHEVHATGHQSLQITGSFQQAGASFGVTQATLLYAAVALVLSVNADSEDVTFGVILTGRESSLDGVLDMIGPAFASFPFRTRVDRRMTMKLLLKRVEDHMTTIIPYQHYGLQQIRKCGEGPARACDLGCLVIVQPEDENLGGEGLWDEVHGQTSGRADSVPVTLEFVLGDGNILVNCNFDPAFLGREEVGLLLGQISHVLKSLESSTSHADLLVSQVELGGEEEQSLYMDWVKRYGAPVDSCLHELFHGYVEQYADTVAIDDQGTQQQLTYCELDTYSSKLGRYLESHHRVGPEIIVPVVMTKSPLAIITMLAVLKAGGAYAPIDPDWPVGRVQHIIQETQASILILCSPDVSEKYHEGLYNTVLVDLTKNCWEQKQGYTEKDRGTEASNQVVKATSGNLACVLYTSGSTGLPKGVMLEHRALCTSLAHLARVFEMKPGTRHLQFSSFVFDLSLGDIFIPLFSGGCICIPTEDNRLNRLSSTMRDMAIESAILTPSLADLILPEDAESLLTLMTAGEMMRTSLIKRWAQKIRLLNGYGLIETSIVTSVSDALSLDASPTNIGRNVTAWHWIVRRDSDGTLYSVPKGCVGEIAVAGHVLARGYVNKPSLTEKHFIEAPGLTAGLTTSRIYLTGDLGKYTADGNICLLGRNDQMVKVNGIRVEAGESEQQLRQQGGIFTSCVVQWLQDDQSNTRLAAFVEVGSSNSDKLADSSIIAVEESTQAFQESCRHAQLQLRDLLLVQYIPTLFVPIRWIPYTTSGKVNLKLLKEELHKVPSMFEVFSVSKDVKQSGGEPPATRSEIALESSFRQVFMKEEKYHTHVDFFTQGGDSFSAIRLVSAARKHGWEISVQQVYRHPRLKDLAAVACPVQNCVKFLQAFSMVDETDLDSYVSVATEKCGVRKTQVLDIYPCTAMQEALMISSAKSSGGFFNQEVFKLAEETSSAALEAALQSVWAKHAILRTRIILDLEYRSFQVVIDEKLEVTLHTEPSVKDYLRKDAARVPGYGDKLCRCAIVKCALGSYLVLSQHHAVYDGWSMNLVLADIEQQYFATNSPRDPSPPSFSSFLQYVTELHRTPEAENYWKQNLQGVSVTAIPQIKKPAHFEANQKYAMQIQLPIDDRHSLATIAEAAWGLLLCRYTGLEDVTFGSIRTGRTAPVENIESVVGPTIVTVPRRVVAPRGQRVSSYLEGIETTIVDALPWEQFGHHNIRKLSPDAHKACQFSSLLVIQALSPKSERPTSKILIPQVIGDGLFKEDCLTVECQPRGNQLIITTMYDDRAVTREEVGWISYNFSRILTELVSKPRRNLQDLDIIGPKGTKQVQMWNSSSLIPSLTRVDDIFTSRARECPSLNAVNATDAVLTYAELDTLSSSLAATFRTLGIGRGSIVPLLMSKSAVAIVCILAILKAGAAYVPLALDSAWRQLDLLRGRLEIEIVLCTPDQEPQLLNHAIQAVCCTIDDFKQGDYSKFPSIQHVRKSKKVLKVPQTAAHSDLAYIAFSSEDGESPKGILFDHTALSTAILSSSQRMDMKATRNLSFFPYTCHISVLEIWLTLLHGGCLFLPTEKQQAEDFCGYMNENKIELAFLTSTIVKSLLPIPTRLPALKTVYATGEPVSPTLLEQWNPKVRLVNLYGSAESLASATMNDFVTKMADPNNIGHSLAGRVWVVDPEDYSRLAPVGCRGELLVSGSALACGYLSNTKIAKPVFINSTTFPWALPGEAQFYATGDIVRQNSDGSINYIAKKDHCSNMNGLPVEVEEIEYEIERCEGIVSAVVEKFGSSENSSEFLVAFFTSAATTRIGDQCELLDMTDAVKDLTQTAFACVSERWPLDMVPRFYLPIRALPISTTGRVNRKALRHVFDQYSHNDMTMYRPGERQKRKTQTSIEKVLQELWAQIWSLDPNQIDLDSQFLTLGGDSLTAIKLSVMCREVGFHLEVADILRNTKFEDLARLVEEGQDHAPNGLPHSEGINGTSITKDDESDETSTNFKQAASICDLEISQIEDIYPCTPTMEALIAVTARLPEAYIARELFQIPPNVDVQRFCSAWDLISRNNPIMRTRVCSILIDGEFKSVQVVCNMPHDWSVSASDQAFNASMTMGSSLFRYRIQNSRKGAVFEVVKHHAVFDGYSTAMLWEDFQYAFEYSKPPPLRTPFKNYVSHIQAKCDEEATEFWRQSTSDFHGEHFPALPSSQYTPMTASSHRIEVSLKWDKSCQFTFATVARAAWAIILSMRSRSSGQTKKACFAVTTSGRGTALPGIEKMAGPTITTIPVLVELDKDKSIAEYLSQIHEQALSMMPYEYYGLSQIQKVSASAREASRTPNLLVIQPSHLEDDVLPLGLSRIMDNQSGMVDSYGLVTECWQNNLTHTISLSASYDPLLIQKQEVNCMLQQLSWMIANLNKNSASLSTIQSTIWSLAEEHDFSQLQAWNATPQPSPNTCLHELFEISAARKPHGLAVDAHDGKLTYAELDTAADAVKDALIRRHGIGPGDLVPLYFEKSVSLLVAMLGVLKAGAAYVPLDTSHPRSRLEFIIQEVEAKVVVVSNSQRNTSNFSVQTLALESQFPFIRSHSNQSSHQTRRATPQDVAYVIFTSGSTGQPKGVVMEHGAASLSILEHGKRYKHDERGDKTRALQFSSYTFDASVLDIFAVLAYGGCVCVPSEEDRMSNLQETFVKMKINFVDLTPTVANLLDPAALPALTALTLAGEMAGRALIDKWSCREPPLEVFVNSYGPTEAAISCAIGAISTKTPVGHVGKRLGGYLWIVDEDDHQHLMPIGCIGELVVSGPTLARGYLNDAAKTNAAFIRDVRWMAKAKDNVLYKTGDLARFDFDGNVEIVGRKDDGQVKLNGLRIELGEIENGIQSCPQFSKARHIAVAKINISGNHTLAAFLQLPDCQAVSPDSPLAHPSKMFKQAISNAAHALQTHLPQYMIPKLWIPICSWPLNAAGKTDRKRLVSVAESQTSSKLMEYLRTTKADCNGNSEDIKTRAQEFLDDAWKQVLSRDDSVRFELHDDFFAVGGDSLRTIMLISLLKTKGIKVTAQDIFGAKSLRDMANTIYNQNPEYTWGHADSLSRDQNVNGQQQSPSTTTSSITEGINEKEKPPIFAIETEFEEVYPASYMQLSYLIESQKWCRSYYCWFFIDVDKSPIPRIREACAALALRHPIFRTSFHFIDDECYQVVQKTAPNFKTLFSNFSPADWCDELDKDVAHPACFGEILTRFRLLIDLETNKRVLALGLSHAQYDGFCTPTILNDLSLAYAGKCWENPSPPRYRDFIRHTTHLCNDATDSFWREKLEGSTLTSIVRPLRDNARPIMSQSSKRTIPFEFKHSGSTSYPVMLKVAWAIALSQVSQTMDITFGNLVSGRYAAFEGAQEVVGPCLNVIPFRVRMNPDQPISGLLKDAYDLDMDTIPFEATPFNRIAAQSSWPAGAGFKSIFQFQNIPGREDKDQILAGSGWKKLGSAVYGGGLLQSGACWLTAWPSVGGTARFLLRYSGDTMETNEAEAVMDLFVNVLVLINNDPDASVASVTKLFPSTRIQSHESMPLQPRLPPSSSQDQSPAPFNTSIMEEFKSIWKSVLDFEGEIRPEDSFFEIGGNSIAAARLASVYMKMGLSLTLQDIIDYPSLMSQVECATGRAKSVGKAREGPKLVYEENYEFI